MAGPAIFQKTSLQLYRDCLRLVRHLTPGFSAKALALRATVRTEFEKNRHLDDEAQVDAAKSSAVRALANYMLFANASKDSKVKPAMKKFHDKTVQETANAASVSTPSPRALQQVNSTTCDRATLAASITKHNHQ